MIMNVYMFIIQHHYLTESLMGVTRTVHQYHIIYIAFGFCLEKNKSWKGKGLESNSRKSSNET